MVGRFSQQQVENTGVVFRRLKPDPGGPKHVENTPGAGLQVIRGWKPQFQLRLRLSLGTRVVVDSDVLYDGAILPADFHGLEIEWGATGNGAGEALELMIHQTRRVGLVATPEKGPQIWEFLRLTSGTIAANDAESIWDDFTQSPIWPQGPLSAPPDEEHYGYSQAGYRKWTRKYLVGFIQVDVATGASGSNVYVMAYKDITTGAANEPGYYHKGVFHNLSANVNFTTAGITNATNVHVWRPGMNRGSATANDEPSPGLLWPAGGGMVVLENNSAGTMNYTARLGWAESV